LISINQQRPVIAVGGEKAGADFLVMPCNSLHVFIDEIRNAVGIPVLSIIEETVRFLKANNLQKVGIVSTSATIFIKGRLYQRISPVITARMAHTAIEYSRHLAIAI